MLSKVYLKSQQIFKDFSDFVTNSYGESWNSSACETSWVPVHNQWVPIKKKTIPKLKMPGTLCHQTVQLWRQTPKLHITVYWNKNIVPLF